MLLAIETSQRYGSVALATDGDVRQEPLRVESRHDQDLIPAIDRLLAPTGDAPSAITAIGISIGPGGFTGLRVGVSTAKAIALTGQQPLYAIPTALLVAAATGVRDGAAVVALASKGDQFWNTIVDLDGPRSQLRAPGAPATSDAVDFDGMTHLIADDHAPAALVDRARTHGVTCLAPSFDAATIAHVLAAAPSADAWRTSAAALAPIYAREPEAVRLAQLRAGP